MLRIHDIHLISAFRNKPFDIYPTQYHRLKRGMKIKIHSGLTLKVLNVYGDSLRIRLINGIVIRLRYHFGIRFKLRNHYNQVKLKYINRDYNRENYDPLTKDYFI